MADREPSVRNDAAAWSDFDADEYWHINYSSVLPEDAEIIQCASKFLIEACGMRLRLPSEPWTSGLALISIRDC